MSLFQAQDYGPQNLHQMTAIAPMPTVTYRWQVLLPGKAWGGTMQVPDCETAFEHAHRRLLWSWQLNNGVDVLGIPYPGIPIVIWRRES